MRIHSVAGVARDDDHAILKKTVAILDLVRAAGDEIEQANRLPDHVSAAMKDAGVYGMAMPAEWGGPELDLVTQMRVIEALGMADGSAGWCAMINCDGGYYSAMLDQTAARKMYSDIWVATGGATTPTGTAELVDGGYRVSGRFPFVSGVYNCAWVWLGCTVTKDGVPQVNENGMPVTRQCFVTPAEITIMDNWQTMGLRGTGSNDVTADNVFVPAKRTFSFQEPMGRQSKSPLYASPHIYLLKASAPPLGIARHAIDIFREGFAERPARRHVRGEFLEDARALADEAYVQSAIGEAEAVLASARSHVMYLVSDVWETLSAGMPLAPAQELGIQSMYPEVTRLCTRAVSLVFEAAGASSVYSKNGLERCYRDILTARQHLIASTKRLESSGQGFLGRMPFTLLL